MRSALIIVCIALQLGVLGYMIYGRESVVAGGQRIYMATAPIDPRDPFRGDFVRLRYAASNIDSAPGEWSDPDIVFRKGEVVYALLEQQPNGLYEAVLYTDTPPETGLYLRGRTSYGRTLFGRRAQSGVRFGIEQLFVEQGSGIAIEEKRGVRGGMQTAMEVEIAVDSKGTAIITGYRWSDVGVQIELTDNFRLRRDTAPGDQTGSGEALNNTHIILQVQNVSDQTVMLNNPGDNCGFRIEPANRESKYSEAMNSCTNLDSVELLTLKPGEKYRLDIDLTSPRWLMSYSDNGTVATGDLREFKISEMIRVVYRGGRSVQPSDLSADSVNGEIWRGNLFSQGFNSRGRVD